MDTPKAVLLLTGAWHVPEHYQKVVHQLESRGIRVICPCLPTNNNAIPPNKSIGDDIAFIKSIAAEEASKGTHLYILAHSYGGMIASGALGEFAIQPESGKGGVANIIYMTAFVPSEGQCLVDMLGGQLPPHFLATDPETNTVIVTADPIYHLYNDVPEEEAKWAESIRVAHPHDAHHTAIDCETAAWRVIPVSYLVCENDQALLAIAQEAMIENVKNNGVNIEVFRCEGGHSPFLSMPEKVVEVVETVMSTH